MNLHCSKVNAVFSYPLKYTILLEFLYELTLFLLNKAIIWRNISFQVVIIHITLDIERVVDYLPIAKAHAKHVNILAVGHALDLERMFF